MGHGKGTFVVGVVGGEVGTKLRIKCQLLGGIISQLIANNTPQDAIESHGVASRAVCKTYCCKRCW